LLTGTRKTAPAGGCWSRKETNPSGAQLTPRQDVDSVKLAPSGSVAQTLPPQEPASVTQPPFPSS